MDKKIAGLIFLLLFIFAAMGTMTRSYFLDNENTADNLLAAGTLDLKTNDGDGVTLVLNAASLKPNNSSGPAPITLHNAGMMKGTALDIKLNYLESDGPQNDTLNMNCDATAAVIEVTALTYDGADLLNGIPDFNSNSYKDVQDVSQSDLKGQSGLDANESKDLVISVKMRDGIDNNFQGDGIDITLTFDLRQ